MPIDPWKNLPRAGNLTEDGHHLLHAVSRKVDAGVRTVLVVDDEMSIRRLVRRQLEDVDPRVHVLEAGDGREALTRLQEIRTTTGHDPALIILDLWMPVMDGWSLVKTLRKEYEARGQTSGIPIIILSASPGEKGVLVHQSVLDGRSGYTPLVTVAKDNCAAAARYDARGGEGLLGWVRHFLAPS